jgi:hypothetical protein
VAQALLDGVLDWFADNAPDPPLPARQYVAGGDPRAVAWDTTDGQVTVTLGRIMLGLDATRAPGVQRVPRATPANHGASQRTASYEVQIVRCAPGLAGPETLHDHGLQVTADAGHLIAACLSVAKTGQLTRSPVAEAGVTVEDLVTLGPDGGAAACAVTVTVPLL